MREAFLELGDETDAPQIARLIVERRSQQPITTTIQLADIISEARDFTPQRAAGAKLHPAARTFQALRMLVNRETHNLERLLKVAPQILKPGGHIRHHLLPLRRRPAGKTFLPRKSAGRLVFQDFRRAGHRRRGGAEEQSAITQREAAPGRK